MLPPPSSAFEIKLCLLNPLNLLKDRFSVNVSKGSNHIFCSIVLRLLYMYTHISCTSRIIYQSVVESQVRLAAF